MIVLVMGLRASCDKAHAAFHLGGALAVQGRRVVLVDLDRWGPTERLLASRHGPPGALAACLRGEATDLTPLIRPTRVPRLALIPSDEVFLEAVIAEGRFDPALPAALACLASCDVVVLDVDPDWPEAAGLAAVAHHAIIALNVEYGRRFGLRQTIRRLRDAAATAGSPRAIGILPTRAELRRRSTREEIACLRADWGEQVMEPLRTLVAVERSYAVGRPLAHCERTSLVALEGAGGHGMQPEAVCKGE